MNHDQPQSQHAVTTSGHSNAAGDGVIRAATSEAPTQPPPEHQRSSEAQGVSVEVLARYEKRLCELTKEVKDLENKLNDAIMQLERIFGSGKAAMQKVVK